MQRSSGNAERHAHDFADRSAERPDADFAEFDADFAEFIASRIRKVTSRNSTCSKCNPYWYNWYCRGCKRVNKYQHWTPRLHYGHERTGSGLTVRQSCGCCRSQHRDSFPCEACDDLWELKGTCHTMQDLVKTYNGT